MYICWKPPGSPGARRSQWLQRDQSSTTVIAAQPFVREQSSPLHNGWTGRPAAHVRKEQVWRCAGRRIDDGPGSSYALLPAHAPLSRRSSFPFACSASSRARVVFGELLRGMVQSGTEYRDQYRKLTDALEGSGSASKPTLSLGPDKTASSIGLPWCSSAVQPEVEWRRKVWAPVGVPVDVHYTPSSRKVGSLPMKSFHLVPAYDRAKEAGTGAICRRSTPWRDGSRRGHRPSAGVLSFDVLLASDRQAEILAGAEASLRPLRPDRRLDRQSPLRSAPITDAGSLLDDDQPVVHAATDGGLAAAPAARLQNVLLRSRALPRLHPARCPTAPLEGGTALHSTRYLGVHDSDGSRKLIEVDTTARRRRPTLGSCLPSRWSRHPAAARSLCLLAPVHAHAGHRPQVAMSASELADPTATARHVASLREPRQPWPAAAAITLKHRRPCAMDTKYGVPIFNEHKIWNKQAAAARGRHGAMR